MRMEASRQPRQMILPPSKLRPMRAVDPNLAISHLETRRRDSPVRRALAVYGLLLGVFAATAPVLARSVDIFGVLSHAVAHRARELGIRPRAGRARQAGVRLRAALVFAGLGIVAALQVTLVMATLLFELTPTDPIGRS